MKKTLLSLALVAGLGLAANAQTAPAKFGVKAGITFPNMTLSTDGVSASQKSNTSFYLGGTVDLALSEMFAVQPGLTLIGKGTKASDTDEGGVSTEKIGIMYLEIPVNFVASFQAGSGKVFVGAGPYYAFALGGKSKYEDSEGTYKEDIQFGSSDDDMLKGGDLGLNFLAGYQLSNGFNVHAGYGLGLTNLNPSSESDNYKIKNKVFSVGVGFSF